MAAPCPLAELMARAQEGDRGAFDDVVRALHRVVYGYARRALGDEEAAAEATQETFVRAWRYRASWQREGDLRAWVVAIAANRVREARGRRPAPASLDEPESLPASSADALEQLARGALRAEVSRAVDALPAELREVVTLRYLAELSYDEVGRALAISAGAARMRALRARDALARALRRLISTDGGSAA